MHHVPVRPKIPKEEWPKTVAHVNGVRAIVFYVDMPICIIATKLASVSTGNASEPKCVYMLTTVLLGEWRN